MFVLAYDMSVADVQARHPRGSRQAYDDIRTTLSKYGFEREQGSVYVAGSEDLASLFGAIDALRALEWFGPSTRNHQSLRRARSC